jgi:DNA-binding GntR family transcriptional regulator
VYELRRAVESLAARLAAAQRADVTNLENAFCKMQAATARRNVREMIAADLEFNMELCRVSIILISSKRAVGYCSQPSRLRGSE